MLKLYFSPGSCSMAVHLALEEVGAPYETVLVSTSDGSAQKPDYLAINPKGRIPALAIPAEKRVLTEAPAILLYLAQAYPQPGLFPVEPIAQARCLEWLNWLSGWLHSVGFGGLWRPQRFVDREKDFPPVTAKARETIRDGFHMIESAVRDGPLIGDALSIADMFLLVFFRWGNRINIVMANEYPRWTSWARLMEARPATARVLAQEGVSLWR